MAIKEYLISVTAASVVCGIIRSIAGKKGSIASSVKMLSGVFMVIVMIAPIVDLRVDNIRLYTDGLTSEVQSAANVGQSAALEEMESIIISQTQAYILDKAAEMKADLDVSVFLCDCVPCEVQIIGAASPHVKAQLSKFIEDNLGISAEDQIWIG